MDPVRLSAREVEAVEANAVARGVAPEDLMEAAGRAVAEEAARRLRSPGARVAVLAGPGNNGGDGFVAARWLAAAGFRPEVWRVRPELPVRPGPAARAYRRLRGRVPVHRGLPRAGDLAPFALALDAMLGTGQAGPLRPPYAEAVRELTASGVPILSLDVPTGIGAPGAVRPRATVTFTAAKVPMTRSNSGEILVREIGIPREAIDETGPGEYLLDPFAPPLPREVRVVVVGGGPYSGAPALAALAALRAGAERATVLAPGAIRSEVRAASPAIVVEAIGPGDRFRARDAPEILRRLRSARVDAVALGMGAGRDRSTVAALEAVLRGLPARMPVVVDADGLEAALALPRRPIRPGIVLTPNRGELLRILRGAADDRPGADPTAALRRLVRGRGFTVLAKGDPDWIVDGVRNARNRHHHPAGMVAGAGDVLDGVLAALLGAGVPPFAAARLAAYWVGDAGERLAGRLGYGQIATDLLEELPRARRAAPAGRPAGPGAAPADGTQT